jgi:hypothetical protein
MPDQKTLAAIAADLVEIMIELQTCTDHLPDLHRKCRGLAAAAGMIAVNLAGHLAAAAIDEVFEDPQLTAFGQAGPDSRVDRQQYRDAAARSSRDLDAT